MFCKKENYTYIRNQPKNEAILKLLPMPTQFPPVERSGTHVENYNYGYNYALYKPPRRENEPTQSEEKMWKGVM
jgi:hypothetical protein